MATNADIEGPLEEAPRTIKCIVVGDKGVGKTSLIICYTTDVFPEAFVPSVFDDYAAKIKVEDKMVRYKIWDTAGEQEYDQIRPLSYPNVDVFLLCFSKSDPASFENVKTKWVPELKQHVSANTPIVLVGTKQDLEEDPDTLKTLNDRSLAPISSAQGSALAEEIDAAKYVEISALQKQGLKEAFEEALRAGWQYQLHVKVPVEKETVPSVKCTIVGDAGVGKTCLLISYTTKVFLTENVPSKYDTYTANMSVNGEPLEYVLQDTVGGKDFDQHRHIDYVDTNIFLVCFAIDDPESFESVKTRWIPELKARHSKTPWILVGTKQDLREDPDTVEKLKKSYLSPITITQGCELADELKAVTYLECSALAGEGIQKVFDTALNTAILYHFVTDDEVGGADVPACCKCC